MNATLVIKNNLTGLEMIPISAFGDVSRLVLSRIVIQKSLLETKEIFVENSEILEKHFLNFELTESELENVLAQKKGVIMRKFILQNQGNLSIFIKKFSIDMNDCQGHGYQIINCFPTKIKENESKELSVALNLNPQNLKSQRYDLFMYTQKYYFRFQIGLTIPPALQELITQKVHERPSFVWQLGWFLTISVILVNFYSFLLEIRKQRMKSQHKTLLTYRTLLQQLNNFGDRVQLKPSTTAQTEKKSSAKELLLRMQTLNHERRK